MASGLLIDSNWSLHLAITNFQRDKDDHRSRTDQHAIGDQECSTETDAQVLGY